MKNRYGLSTLLTRTMDHRHQVSRVTLICEILAIFPPWESNDSISTSPPIDGVRCETRSLAWKHTLQQRQEATA